MGKLPRQLADRYMPDDLLGSGAMGDVFRATDAQSGETVAVKSLKADLVRRDPDMLERFKREGEALRDLNHPNIVTLLDVVEEGETHYLVMEYIPGGDLAGLLSDSPGGLSLDRALSIALDLADALTRAHRLGIIHRDLKPANVLIAHDGTPRLTDFGVAHFAGQDSVTQEGAVVGTYAYLSPEACMGLPLDEQADIWSFGVLLYEMLTGERPFKGDSPGAVITRILQTPLPDIQAIRADADDAISDLLYRMLEKSRDARIPSVRLVGAEIEALLKGIEVTPRRAPAGVFAPGKPSVFVTPTPAEDKHYLPAQTTPFVGRETEMAELDSLLKDSQARLTTIVAPGGMGKTRLCIEAAQRQLEQFRNGIYFIELAPLSDPDDIVQAICKATGYQLQQDGREYIQQLQEYLSHKQMLLVMDNFEHLVAGAGITTAILQASPEVRILVTSRQRLNQSGERLFPLGGMDFASLETLEEAERYAAIQLFVQSAQRVQPQFQLDVENVKDVARICALVQGMPLGIVLAASWISMLQPSEIAAEIERSFDFLESNMGDLPERQRSMHAVFEYSWNLMTEADQQVFGNLSIFRGGFTREAAQAVAGSSLRTLMSLNNMSLIRRDAKSGRYEVHELLRQYAEEHLNADPQSSSRVKDAHRDYFAELLARSWKLLKTSKQRETMAYLDPDIENIRIAWQAALAKDDPGQIIKFVDALWFIQEVHGWYQAMNDMLEAGIRVLESTNRTTEIDMALAVFKSYQAYNCTLLGNLEQGIALSKEAISMYDGLPHNQQAHLTVVHLGEVMCDLSLNDGASLEEAATRFRSAAQTANEPLWEGIALNYMVPGLAMQGKLQEARERSRDSLRVLKGVNDNWGMFWAYLVEGAMEMSSGELDAARTSYSQALRVALEINYRRGIQQAYDNLGDVAFASTDFAAAERYFRNSLRVSNETGQTREMLTTLYDIARCQKEQGKSDQAVELVSIALHHPLIDLQLFLRAQAISLHEAAEQLRIDLGTELKPDIYQAAWLRGKSSVLETVVETLLAQGPPYSTN